jgi:hypothetical protein
LVQKCGDIKQALPVARTTERVIKLTNEKIEQWELAPSLDFTKICVFIDEAGLKLHIQQGYD